MLIQTAFYLSRARLFYRFQSCRPERGAPLGFSIDVRDGRQVSLVCEQGTSFLHVIPVKRGVQEDYIEWHVRPFQPRDRIRVDDFRALRDQGGFIFLQSPHQLFVLFDHDHVPGAAGQGLKAQRPGSGKQVQAARAGHDRGQPVEQCLPHPIRGRAQAGPLGNH